MEAKIVKASLKDADIILQLYRAAREYQRTKDGVVVWPVFGRSLVLAELREGRQFKMMGGNEVACVWAVTFSDALIWGPKNADAAVYVHRIAVHPKFRGRNLVGRIVEWAKEFAHGHGKRYVRLDTVGKNTRLIAHYTANGFQFLGCFPLAETKGLPAHYAQAPVALFQLDLQA
ncbi:GNAT family N-acetyltransferase [Maribacter sp. 2307ULW6-5]|uniref:GNAT family N-acetyltransferase n=1 Tax=Maribacter sp. 2307ULW6-5 TaxID=3386275 RepID=UPI0039BD2C4B